MVNLNVAFDFHGCDIYIKAGLFILVQSLAASSMLLCLEYWCYRASIVAETCGGGSLSSPSGQKTERQRWSGRSFKIADRAILTQSPVYWWGVGNTQRYITCLASHIYYIPKREFTVHPCYTRSNIRYYQNMIPKVKDFKKHPSILRADDYILEMLAS